MKRKRTPVCPECEREIKALYKDVLCKISSVVRIDKSGELQETAYNEDPPDVLYTCLNCNHIFDLATTEDALAFLKGEKYDN